LHRTSPGIAATGTEAGGIEVGRPEEAEPEAAGPEAPAGDWDGAPSDSTGVSMPSWAFAFGEFDVILYAINFATLRPPMTTLADERSQALSADLLLPSNILAKDYQIPLLDTCKFCCSVTL